MGASTATAPCGARSTRLGRVAGGADGCRGGGTAGVNRSGGLSLSTVAGAIPRANGTPGRAPEPSGGSSIQPAGPGDAGAGDGNRHRVVRAGRSLGNASRLPNRNVIDPQILLLGSIVPHVVIEADFIDLQIRSCAPAHALLNDLPLAVNPQLLAAVVLAGGVHFDVEDHLLPRATIQRDLG